MSSPYICLSKAAIKAKLTQNESLIFHALMIQTLGYRKTNDNLTDKRLAQLSGIRLDHFRVVLDSFLQHNLFYRVEHPSYDYQYRICDEFLDDEQTTTVYPPSLPKSGQAREVRGNVPEVGADLPQTLVDLPEVGGHTTENLYIKKPQQQTNQTEKNLLQKKQHTKPLVSFSFTGLEVLPEQLVIESDQPIRLEFSAKEIDNRIQTTEETMDTISEKFIKPNSDNDDVLENKADTLTVPEPVIETINTVEIAKTATTRTVAELAEQFVHSSVTSKQNEQVDKPDSADHPPSQKARNALPTVIEKSYVNACQRHFDCLNDQQQKDVLTVFFQQLKAGAIKNKSRYFIGLAKKAKQGGLVVTQESITKNIPAPYSPEAFAKAQEADKERQQRATLWSDYQWLKQQAVAQNKTEQELAAQMCMEDAYALFHPIEQENVCMV